MRGALVLVGVAAFALGTSPAVTSVDATAAPVVTFTVSNSTVKVSGAKGLKAGWITIKASTKDGPHNLWFFQDKSPAMVPAAPAPAKPAAKRMRAIRPPAASGPSAANPPSKTQRNQSISAAGELEESVVGLGGFYIDPKHPVTMKVKLPKGTVSVMDRMAFSNLVNLTIGSTGTAKGPAKPTANITVNDRNALVAPSTLPAKGVLQFSNISKRVENWHDLAIRRLKPGKKVADVQKYFKTFDEKFNPFVGPKGGSEDATGSAPMSAQRNQQVSYSLAPGSYAVFDAWLDEEGRSNAEKGAVKVFKVK